MKTVPKSIDQCRTLFSEIVRGYSYSEKLRLFFKHHSEYEMAELERDRETLADLAKKTELLGEKEKLKLLDEGGHWTKEEEEEFQQKIQVIEDLKQGAVKFVIPEQRKLAEDDIRDRSNRLAAYMSTREELVGLTTEKFVNRKVTEKIVVNSCFKDKSLSELAYEPEEIEMDQLRDLVNEFNQIYQPFVEKTFRRICVCPFFINLYSVSDNLFYMFNKPLVDLTSYQSSLLLRAKFYKSLFESGDCAHPPEQYYDENVGKVVVFYDQQYSLILSKRRQQAAKARKTV